MSQERVIHVGDNVHYRWDSGNVVAGTVGCITASDFGVRLHLRTHSNHTILVSPDDKAVCLAESVKGVTVGADGTVATSKSDTEAGDTEAGDTEDDPLYTFGYVVQHRSESFGNMWYTGATWSSHRRHALVFASRDTAERVARSYAGYDAHRVRRLVAGDAERIVDEAVVGYVIRVLPGGPGNTVYIGRHSLTTHPGGANIYPARDVALRALATVEAAHPGAHIVPVFPDPENLSAATESEPKPTPVSTFGYIITNNKTSEWITDINAWTVDPQFARIFRGNESEESERERADLSEALCKRPDRRWAPLVEDTEQFKRHVFGYVVQSPGRLAGPDDCAKYWTGLIPWSTATAWSTNPLKATIFRDPESARRVRWHFADDARVLRLVEGDGRCS